MEVMTQELAQELARELGGMVAASSQAKRSSRRSSFRENLRTESSADSALQGTSGRMACSLVRLQHAEAKVASSSFLLRSSFKQSSLSEPACHQQLEEKAAWHKQPSTKAASTALRMMTAWKAWLAFSFVRPLVSQLRALSFQLTLRSFALRKAACTN